MRGAWQAWWLALALAAAVAAQTDTRHLSEDAALRGCVREERLRTLHQSTVVSASVHAHSRLDISSEN
ncbi:hypothetical protein RR48_03334 [Papilio machaon]|uniref:Uncharacterized protein n=1 Tax=Papilio machaon TaxID=76193 RepID=A0A0N1IIV4_PAPMA|nr:hypothetical protein RR48_03334 [Papilio machaon]